MLRKNSCSRKRKLLQELGEILPQNVKRTTRSEFVLAYKVAHLEAGKSLFDLSKRVSCRAEYGTQFSVNCLGARAFEKDEFDDESLLRFFHLAKCRGVDAMSIIISSFTVPCCISAKILDVRNEQVFISFQIIIVTLR
jgi:hypothetical protein